MTLKGQVKTPEDLLRRIPILNRQRQAKIDRKAVALFCANVLRSLNERNRALSIVFVNAQEIRSINNKYRGKDHATNVLSFAYGGIWIEEMSFIGEIIIALEVAFREAVRCGVPPENEVRKLLVHGILHLLGYDHETDDGQMNRMQSRLMRRKFFLNTPSLMQSKVLG